MNKNERRGPSPALLALIPIGLLIAKGVGKRRRMLESGDAAGHRRGRGPGHWFGGDFDAQGRPQFTLPPRMEAILGAWHARVHAATDGETTPATPGTATV